MKIEIHQNKLVIEVDLDQVNNLAKLAIADAAKQIQAPAEAPAIVESVTPEQPKEEVVESPKVEATPSEEDILGGEAPVKEVPVKKEAAKKEAPKSAPKAEPKKEAPKSAPKAEAKAEPAVKYDRTDVKHREALTSIIEEVLGKDWKESEVVRNKVGDFSKKAHGTMDFLVKGKPAPAFVEAFKAAVK